MSYIDATPEFGLIVREGSLLEKDISHSTLTEIMQDIDVLGENDDIISYGPMFGEEALQEIRSRLSSAGFEYVDDYFDLNFLMPDWAKLGVSSIS